MDNPDNDPVILRGHHGEVTAVDWYIALKCLAE